MFALTEMERISLLGAGATILVALIALAGTITTVVVQARRTRNELVTDNGHSIGTSTKRIEDTQAEHLQRLYSIELQVRELRQESADERSALEAHITENGPLVDWVREQMKGES